MFARVHEILAASLYLTCTWCGLTSLGAYLYISLIKSLLRSLVDFKNKKFFSLRSFEFSLCILDTGSLPCI